MIALQQTKGVYQRNIYLILILFMSAVVKAQPVNDDCPNGEFLCTKDDVVVPDGTGDDGSFEEIPSCFGSGEVSSDWYIFTAATTGTLTFEINPNTPTNFDWALYNITGGPAPTCDYGDQIACNSANTTGITGMGCVGIACAPAMMLTAGDTYAILINRLSAAFGSGYTLSFGGTVEFGSPTAAIDDAMVCVGQEVEFENQGSGYATYFWTFGDGTTSTEYNPELSYDAPGVYTVTLLVTAEPGGCFSEATATVTVSEGPTLTIEPAAPVICAGESVPLDLSFVLSTGPCTPLLFEMDEGFEIPGGPSLNSPINVSGVTPATFSPDMLVSVCLQIEHETDDQLDISLQCPDGTIIELSTDNGGAGNNYDGTCFVPTGAPSITTGVAPFTGSYLPEGS
ncbi:MAG: PKD domain-containing protein, partial [Chitinophagales bacterium]